MKRRHITTPFEWHDSDETGQEDVWSRDHDDDSSPPIEQEEFNAQNTIQVSAGDKRGAAGAGGASRGRAPPDDTPRVSSRDNFLKLYNKSMNRRFPPDMTMAATATTTTMESEPDESSHEQPVSPGTPEMTPALFDSLFEDEPAPAPQQQAPPQRAQARQRKKQRLVQPPQWQQSRQVVVAPHYAPYDKETRHECFMCAWGNRYHDGMEAHHVARMNEIMDQYGGCDNVELGQQLVLYFAKYVYKGLVARYPGTPMLTLPVAVEHIEHHILDAVIKQGQAVRRLDELLFNLYEVAFHSNGRPDKDTITLIMQAERMMNTKLTMKVENMLFNHGKSNEDTRKMGRRFAFMEIFKQRQEREDRRLRIEEEQGAEGDDEFDV